MPISQTAEYALRAIVCLASRPRDSVTTQKLAEVTRVPANYLSKLMQILRKEGLVKAQRGVGGGFLLTRPPDQISVLDVVGAVDGIQRIRTCPLGLAAHGNRLCPMHKRLDAAMAYVERVFDETSVLSLLDETSESRPMCLDQFDENLERDRGASSDIHLPEGVGHSHTT